MVRVLWLTRKGDNVEDRRAAVDACVQRMWPGAVVVDSGTAWTVALPVTAGRFAAYIDHVTRGAGSDGGPSYAAFVTDEDTVGKASADIIEAGALAGRETYLLDTSAPFWWRVTRVVRGDGRFADARVICE